MLYSSSVKGMLAALGLGTVHVSLRTLALHLDKRRLETCAFHASCHCSRFLVATWMDLPEAISLWGGSGYSLLHFCHPEVVWVNVPDQVMYDIKEASNSHRSSGVAYVLFTQLDGKLMSCCCRPCWTVARWRSDRVIALQFQTPGIDPESPD